MTSLQDGSKDHKNPERFLTSETIPYIVIPGYFSKDFIPGDVALVVNNRNNKRSFAIFALTGPADKIGEGSICLTQQSGIPGTHKKGGVSSGMVYILIKKSGKGKVMTKGEIE